MISDMFRRHGIQAIVKSTAVSGTRACQWAMNPQSLVTAAYQEFGWAGPQYVWFTLGGNDLLDPKYSRCANSAQTYEAAVQCALQNVGEVNNCNFKLLDNFYQRFPNSAVVQCAYDFQCSEGLCLPLARWPFCKYDA